MVKKVRETDVAEPILNYLRDSVPWQLSKRVRSQRNKVVLQAHTDALVSEVAVYEEVDGAEQTEVASECG